ncbi:MAG: hypothetical protein ACREU6_08640 [Steroidobacteraceae bacterium]
MMRVRGTLFVCAAAALVQISSCSTAVPPAPAPAPKVQASLNQVMQGIVFPSANVVFAAQDDLGKFPPAEDPGLSPNPITSAYGQWQAVENAALALSEAANLLILPGRLCSNGAPVPVQRQDWAKYVQQLRDAGMAAYKAAQSKSQDAMTKVSDTVTDACSDCHNAYRDKPGGEKARCLP